MKKLASLALACVLATFGMLLAAPAASAYPDAGPEARFKLAVDRRVLYSGEAFTATASANVRCGWTLAWNGARKVATAKVLRHRFIAPRVTRITRIPLHGRCFYELPGTAPRPQPTVGHGAGQVLSVRVPESWRKTIQITVLPPGSGVSPPDDGGPDGGPDGGNGELPDTGGPPLWALAAGLGSLLLGLAAVRETRRRREPRDPASLVA